MVTDSNRQGTIFHIIVIKSNIIDRPKELDPNPISQQKRSGFTEMKLDKERKELISGPWRR